MVRIIGFFIGLFFAFMALWALGTGIAADAPIMAKYGLGTFVEPTAESVFHKEPRPLHLSSDGWFGHWDASDKEQLQRGFQVYNEVCKACHALKHVAFRDLADLGYDKAEIKAIAAQYQVPHYDPNTGEVTTSDGTPVDHFPPVAYGGQGSPPDLSLIAKAREGGPSYVYSLLTGFEPIPAALTKQFPDFSTPPGLYFNPYFANLNIAMPPPLVSDGQVTYADGTPATVDQMAQDVSAFLAWTAEPSLGKRHQTGWPVLGFLLFATILAYLAKKQVWADAKRRED